MLEGSVGHFKNWIKNGEEKNKVFSYVGIDIWEVYEKIIKRIK